MEGDDAWYFSRVGIIKKKYLQYSEVYFWGNLKQLV